MVASYSVIRDNKGYSTMNNKTLICLRIGMSLFLLGVFLSPTLAQDLPAEVIRYADLVLYNGYVLTMDQDQPPINVAEAVAVRDGRILAVGDDDRILKMAGPRTNRVDLNGRAVIPGVVDTHSHPNSYAIYHFDREWSAARVKFLRENNVRHVQIRWDSKETVLEDLKRVANSTPPGEWIFTNTFSNPVEREELTRYDLDQVTPDNPVFIRVGYGIWGVVNTRMLDIVKEVYGEKLLPGFIKDQQGVPNGRMFGAAGEVIDVELMPQPGPEVFSSLFKRELEEWVAIGVTTLSTRLKGWEISTYGLLDRQDELPLRMAYSHEIGRSNPFLERDLKRFGNLEGHGTERMWLIGITIGNPDGNGPMLPEDIANLIIPEVTGGQVCASLPKRETLPRDLYPEGVCFWDLPDDPGPDASAISNRYGYRVVAVHNFGDKGSLMNLAAYDRANQEKPILDRRFALDHGMMVSPEVVKESAKLGVMWSLQPPLFWGINTAAVSRVYGEEYAHRWVLPVKSLLDAGVKVAYGADVHNDPDRHPMFNLEILVTRRIRDGRVFGPREAIDRSRALLMMTRWSAEYVIRENQIGSVEVGKLADLVLLGKNPLDSNISNEELSEIEVLATLIGGKLEYGSLN
jgi:predicted amidohydrolase YtcJ